MGKIFLVVSGETINKNKKIIGQSDFPLSKRGRIQARKTAEELASEKIKAIYSSDLARALRTAEIINDEVQVDIFKLREFGDRNWGVLEGKTLEEAEKYVSDTPAWRVDFSYCPIGGETGAQLAIRVLSKFDEISLKHLLQRIAIVTHNNVALCMVKHVLGIPPSSNLNFEFAPCSISTLESKANKWFLKTLNDICHLKTRTSGSEQANRGREQVVHQVEIDLQDSS